MSSTPIQALIVDDHALVRQGILRLLLEEWPRCSILECGDAAEARRLLGQRHWDFILLDHHLPDGGGKSHGAGLDLVESISRRGRVLVLSAESSQELMHKAWTLGCGGFVAKSDPPTAFLNAVRTVVEGNRHFPGLDLQSPPPSLSERERQIQQALLDGDKPYQIALALGLTYGTVQTYKSRLFAKLGVSGLAEFFKRKESDPP